MGTLRGFRSCQCASPSLNHFVCSVAVVYLVIPGGRCRPRQVPLSRVERPVSKGLNAYPDSFSSVNMRGPLFLFGTALGVVGALLDFSTGYYVLSQSYGVMDSMGTMVGYDPAGVAWGVGLLLLGLVLTATVVASAFRSRLRMTTEGKLMAVYGAAMIFIGASMYLGFAPMMGGSSLSGFAMLGVGILMIANGALMSRKMM